MQYKNNIGQNNMLYPKLMDRYRTIVLLRLVFKNKIFSLENYIIELLLLDKYTI